MAICGVPVLLRPFLWGLHSVWGIYKTPQNICLLKVITLEAESIEGDRAQVGLKSKLILGCLPYFSCNKNMIKII